MIYDKNSESKRVLEDIVEDMYLVCLVDNDYVTGTWDNEIVFK